MDSPRDSAKAGSTDEFEGLGRVLDRGLIGPEAGERFERLLAHLGATDAPSPDPEILALVTRRLASRELSLRDALSQYRAATDERRWPIFIVRPNGPHKKLEDRFINMGLPVVPSLASAYRGVGLIPVRVPPAPEFVYGLAKRPDIQRIERSWTQLQMPAQLATGGDELLYPEQMLQPGAWPPEILNGRDPLRVGLIDSGIDARHPVLQTLLLDQRVFRRGADRVGDRVGHGTASAGIIARMCPSARFASAKVIDADGCGNADDLVRALAWLRRTRPDVLLCNLGFSTPAHESGVVGKLLADFVDDGVTVIIPVIGADGQPTAPAGPEFLMTVADDGAGAGSGATLLARGRRLRVPRSIQSNKTRFPEGQPSGWTCFDSAGGAAALVTGTVCLLLRAARHKGLRLTPAEVRTALLAGCNAQRTLSPQTAVTGYLRQIEGAAVAGPTVGVDVAAGIAAFEDGLIGDDEETSKLPPQAVLEMLHKRSRAAGDDQEPPTLHLDGDESE